MHKALISITTFKKTKALQALLESLVKHGYSEFPIVVADDWSNQKDQFGLSASDVLEEFRGKFASLKLCYNDKSFQLGISRNKNRGIREFLKEPEYESILMLDDDVLMMRRGYIEYCLEVSKKCNIGHLNGYWTDFNQERFESDKLVGLSGLNWHKDFSIKAFLYDPETDTDLVSIHNGTQGCAVWVSRDLMVKTGYFNKMPYTYGMEHSLASARMNMIENLPPEQFPVLRRCHYWIMGQNIPNDYDISHEKLNTIQTQAYQAGLRDVYAGRELLQTESHLPKKGEIVTCL
jgi:GT2 family glycosyltransferase